MQVIYVYLVNAFQQQLDPIAFLEAQQQRQRRVWWSLWIPYIGLWFMTMRGLYWIDLWYGVPNQGLMRLGFSLYLIFFPICGAALGITYQGQFWLIYIFSPLVTLTVFMCGIAAISPFLFIVCWAICLPFLIGNLGVNVCHTWVYRRSKEEEKNRLRRWPNGLSSQQNLNKTVQNEATVEGAEIDLPILGLYQSMHFFRWLLALALTALIIFILINVIPAWSILLGVVMIMVGCLNLDGFLWVTARTTIIIQRDGDDGMPLVKFDERTAQWKATYISRFAMYVPKQSIVHILSAMLPADKNDANKNAIEASSMILALLSQGYLGSTVRNASVHLSAQQIAQLILHLSLQPGGFTVITYLQSIQKPERQAMMQLFIDLVHQASMPLEKQHWIVALQQIHTDILQAELTLAEEGYLVPLLCNSYDMLYQPRPEAEFVNKIIAQMTSLTQTLEQSYLSARTDQRQSNYLTTTWPFALLFHLKQHHYDTTNF